MEDVMKRTVLCVLLFLSLCVCATGKELKIVTEEYPPYEFLQNNKFTGFDVDTVTEACRRIGYTVNIQAFPWKRCLLMMQQGKADAIMSLMNTEERRQFLVFPKESLSNEKNVVFTPTGSGVNVKDFSDLKGLRIGVQSEYSYGVKFDNFKGLDKELCNSPEQMQKMLSGGRMPVAVGNEAVSLYLNKKLGLKPITILYEISNDPLYIGFSKASKINSKDISEKMSKALSDMRKEGLINQFQKKYE